MKIILFTIVLITSVLQSASAQVDRELTVQGQNNDGDTVIEIIEENTDAPDFMHMLLGFNASSDGWLRTITDHDLSFWTHNRKRMTIKNDGRIGIGTGTPLSKLFILNGRQGLETETVSTQVGHGTILSEQTGLDFYTDTDRVGGLTYVNTFFPSVTLDNPNNGTIKLNTNGLERVMVAGNGDVKFLTLAGTGTRNLVVSSDGTIQSGSAASQHQVLSPTHFQNNTLFGEGELQISGYRINPTFGFGDDVVVATSNPVMPFTKYRIDEIELFYLNVSPEKIEFNFSRSGESPIIFESIGNAPGVATQTLNINTVIDQAQGDLAAFSIYFFDSGQTFNKAIIKYTPIYD